MKLRRILCVMIAVLMAAALAAPVFASGEPSGASGEPSGASGEPAEDIFAVPAFPDDAKIVSATTYSVYTKKPDSPQDAVIEATMYWDLTNNKVFYIRFVQPMLPWDDNESDSGWACVADEDLLAALGDALVTFTANVWGEEIELSYAKYLQIGGIVWTGEVSSHPAADPAVDYRAEIGGESVTLNEYVRSQEGGKWYVEAAREQVYFLTDDTPAASESGKNVAKVYSITYKENNGHGVSFWMSDILFPGNMEAIKEFVTENGFGYDYYADGGITQNEDGFWQTPDAVSGATLDETPSYLDALKTLYEEIQAGNYVEEN